MFKKKMSGPEQGVSDMVGRKFAGKVPEKPEKDYAADKKKGIVEGSKRDEKLDKKAGIRS